jgi:hypothetical protein
MKKIYAFAFALLLLHSYANAQVKTIKWSGYTWNVKEPAEAVGPGPNFGAAAMYGLMGAAGCT